jgi:hypothetical protein
MMQIEERTMETLNESEGAAAEQQVRKKNN